MEFDLSINNYCKCNICGKTVPYLKLNKKTYYYGIKCKCHKPEHFETVYYCEDCEPSPPEIITVKLKRKPKRTTNY